MTWHMCKCGANKCRDDDKHADVTQHFTDYRMITPMRMRDKVKQWKGTFDDEDMKSAASATEAEYEEEPDDGHVTDTKGTTAKSQPRKRPPRHPDHPPPGYTKPKVEVVDAIARTSSSKDSVAPKNS